jgi:hypothetical protein
MVPFPAPDRYRRRRWLRHDADLLQDLLGDAADAEFEARQMATVLTSLAEPAAICVPVLPGGAYHAELQNSLPMPPP